MKRIAVLVLMLLLLCPLLSACGSPTEQPVETTGTETKPSSEESSSAEESGSETDQTLGYGFDATFGSQQIDVLYWKDYTMQEFFAENGETGDRINDAIYKRNLQVENNLGIKLEYTGILGNASNMADYVEHVKADVTSSLAEYEIIAAYSQVPAQLAMAGYVRNLMDYDNYLDFESPCWTKALVDELTVNGKLYTCSGDISTNLLWMMIATFFNKTMIESYNMQSPYDLVKNNQWTLDKQMELSTNLYQDLNHNELKDAEDQFGFLVYDINIDAFFTAANLHAIEKDSDDLLIVSPNYTGQKMVDLCDKISAFLRKEEVYHINKTNIRNIFLEERAVFIMDRVFIGGRELQTVKLEYGVVPNAKYSEDQENYYTNVGHPFTMYCISAATKNAEAAAATLQALAVDSYNLVTPEVFEVAMKTKYSLDTTSSMMYDIIRGGVTFDLGRLFTTQFSGNCASSGFRTCVLAGDSWSTYYGTIKRTIGQDCSKINDMFTK